MRNIHYHLGKCRLLGSLFQVTGLEKLFISSVNLWVTQIGDEGNSGSFTGSNGLKYSRSPFVMWILNLIQLTGIFFFLLVYEYKKLCASIHSLSCNLEMGQKQVLFSLILSSFVYHAFKFIWKISANIWADIYLLTRIYLLTIIVTIIMSTLLEWILCFRQIIPMLISLSLF